MWQALVLKRRDSFEALQDIWVSISLQGFAYFNLGIFFKKGRKQLYPPPSKDLDFLLVFHPLKGTGGRFTGNLDPVSNTLMGKG